MVKTSTNVYKENCAVFWSQSSALRDVVFVGITCAQSYITWRYYEKNIPMYHRLLNELCIFAYTFGTICKLRRVIRNSIMICTLHVFMFKTYISTILGENAFSCIYHQKQMLQDCHPRCRHCRFEIKNNNNSQVDHLQHQTFNS